MVRQNCSLRWQECQSECVRSAEAVGRGWKQRMRAINHVATLAVALWLILWCAVPLAALTMGEPAILTVDDCCNGGLLLAQQAALDAPGTLDSLSFYVIAPGGVSLRLAVYNDAGGVPGALQGETASMPAVAGWNTLPTLTQPLLAPGTYWLAYQYAPEGMGFLRAGNVGSYRTVEGWVYGAFPVTWPVGGAGGVDHWSFYATLTMADTPPLPASNVQVIFQAGISLPVTLAWEDGDAIVGFFELERGLQGQGFALIQTLAGLPGVGLTKTTQDSTAPQQAISCWRVRQIADTGGPELPSAYSNVVCSNVE